MNKISKTITLLSILLGSVFFNSCVKEKFDAITTPTPTVDFSSNTTIANLNLLSDSFAGTPSAFGKITQDIIIEGVVVGNDESGNIYKNLYIEDNTGGIDIAIDKPSLYTDYRVGQKIIVNCKGLYIGNYGGVPELGYIYNNGIGRIPAIFIKDHLFLDSFPGNPPVPKLMTIPGLTGANYSTLIRLDSVFFASNDIGKVFADPNLTATDHTIMDKNNNQVVIRTSSYANFANKLTPSKMGSVVGIYSYYGTTKQLYIRDTNDLVNFNQIPPIFLEEPFTTSFGSFTPYSVTGAEAWTITSYGATMSGYTNGNHANEDWLISSSFNLDNYTNEILTFQTTMNYGAAGDGSLRLYYSTNYTSGAPLTGTWTEITGFALSAGGWADTPSGNIDLSAISGSNVHIAFKYISTTSSASTWEILSVLGKGTPN